MKKYLLLLLSTALFSIGCDKTETPPPPDEEETYNPVINIMSPIVGSVDTVGIEMSIEAEITREDNKKIHNVSVFIEDADGNVVDTLIDNAHVHASGFYEIHEHYHPSNHGEYLVRIVTTDHSDASQKVQATRSFTVVESIDYHVTVDIQDPVENTTLNVNHDLAVNVVFTHDHGGTIHHVNIVILDAAENVVATLDDGHKHADGTYTYENAHAYTATATGTFKIVATTMNMDMSMMQMAQRTFTAQ
jgi:hypothetical protein